MSGVRVSWAGLGPLPLLALKHRPPRGCYLEWVAGHSPPPPRPFPGVPPRGSLSHPSPQLPSPPSPPVCSYSVPPEFPSQEPRTLTVMEGHPARLSCECRGVPFPKISWRKDGRMAALAQPHPHCPTGGGCSRPVLGAPTPDLAEVEMF